MAKEAVSAALRAVSVTERAVLLDGRTVAKKTVPVSCRAVSVIKLNFLQFPEELKIISSQYCQ